MILYLDTDGDTLINYEVPLEYESYGIGLIDVQGKIKVQSNNDLFLCCDIIEESYVGNEKLPVLYRLDKDENGKIDCNIYKVLYLRIIRPVISSIRLYICDKKGKIVSLPKNYLRCTLLIIPPK